MAGIGSFEPFGGYFKDLARAVFRRGEPGSRRFPRSPQLGPNPGLSGYYPSMGGSADKSYRGASFPSEEKDIAWALALNIAAQEGRDISDREVQREIFYETFPNAPLDGFKNFMMKVTDPEFEYNPENKDPARFRILDAAGNVIRDFGRGGKDKMANDSGRPVEGCGPGEFYNPVLDRCEVYGPPLPGPPTDAEREDIDEAMDRQSNFKAICNGTLDPDSLSDDEIEVLTKGTMTRAQLKNTSAWCPAEWLEKDEDKKSDSPPSGPPTRGDDSPPGGGTIPGGGTSPGGGGPAPGGGTPDPGQEETGRGGQGQPPLMNGECRPPFVPLNLPGGMVLCGLPSNLPGSGDDKKEEKPEDTGGNNQGEDDTDLPDRGPDTGGGDGDKGGTPEPDENGVCPPGYIGRDTNGDGINDICIPVGRGIRALVSLLGGSGGFPGGDMSDLNKAAQRASASVFNDPLNFARIQPSALQMVDPRYYGISSFVPKGEEPDFNLGYRGVPGQMYANYNVDDKTGALSPRNARNGGIISLAEGGETNFPRKNGQIAGPGTERSDDIPAMLSDGEFVVNAKAVRGIGRLFNGKIKDKKDARREGARTMYALQRAGEKAAGLS